MSDFERKGMSVGYPRDRATARDEHIYNLHVRYVLDRGGRAFVITDRLLNEVSAQANRHCMSYGE